MTSNRFPTLGVLCGWGVYHTQIHPFFDTLLRAIRLEARKNQYNLLIGGSVLRQATPSNLVTAYGGWHIPQDISFLPITPENTDGLIVVIPLHIEARSAYLQRLIDGGFPVVFVNCGEKGSTVYIDCQDAIYRGMQHLLLHGQQQIASIAGEYTVDGTTDGEERLAAYHHFVHEYGLSADPRLVAYGFHTAEGGSQAMRQILE